MLWCADRDVLCTGAAAAGCSSQEDSHGPAVVVLGSIATLLPSLHLSSVDCLMMLCAAVVPAGIFSRVSLLKAQQRALQPTVTSVCEGSGAIL